MKKLLIVAMVCALFAPAFAVENVKVTGDIQTIGISFEDRGLTGGEFNFKGTTNRVLFGLEADLVDDVQAKLTFAHRNVFGMDAETYPEPYVTGENLNTVWEKTYVAEAFVKISNIFDALEVKVGRQFYGDAKSAVLYFGPDYGYAIGNTYTSLDGATAKYNGENFALTAAYFSMNNYAEDYSYPYDDEIYPIREYDVNFGGLDLEAKINENISANAYIYDFKGMDNIKYGFWGAKAALEYEHFNLGAEYARNYGVGNDKGWQVKADLALPLSIEDTSITPRVTYLKSEKNFVAYGNYRPGLMFGTLLGGGINNILSAITMGNEM